MCSASIPLCSRSQHLCVQEAHSSASWRKGLRTHMVVRLWKGTSGLRRGCPPGCKWCPRHSLLTPALFSSLLCWNSYLHSVLGLFLFSVLLFCSQTNSRHRRDDLWLRQADTAPELVSHEKSSGIYPVPESLSDWPYLGHFSFLCWSLGEGTRVFWRVRLVNCSLPRDGTSGLAPLYMHAQDSTGSAPVSCLFHHGVH